MLRSAVFGGNGVGLQLTMRSVAVRRGLGVRHAREGARKRWPLPACWWYAGIRPMLLETGAAALAEPAANRMVKSS
jgi:hypothetical protein